MVLLESSHTAARGYHVPEAGTLPPLHAVIVATDAELQRRRGLAPRVGPELVVHARIGVSAVFAAAKNVGVQCGRAIKFHPACLGG